MNANLPHRNRFAERLKSKRIESGLGQIAFAKLAGITQPTLAKYETCKREPDLDGLLAICERLGVTPNEMLGVDCTNSNAVSAGDGALIAIGNNIQQTVTSSKRRSRKDPQ
jgi:transcriptional regulator with XRE-family HTH domain